MNKAWFVFVSCFHREVSSAVHASQGLLVMDIWDAILVTCAPIHTIPATWMHSVLQQEQANSSAWYGNDSLNIKTNRWHVVCLIGQSLSTMHCVPSCLQLINWGNMLSQLICILLIQCRDGYAGDGEECELDPDLDDIPVKGLSCTLPNCRKVCLFLRMCTLLSEWFIFDMFLYSVYNWFRGNVC